MFPDSEPLPIILPGTFENCSSTWALIFSIIRAFCNFLEKISY